MSADRDRDRADRDPADHDPADHDPADHDPADHDPAARDRDARAREPNPLGLGPRDRESSNTGSIEDTAYDAVASDPYVTGEPRRPPRDAGPSTPADPDVPGSEEP